MKPLVIYTHQGMGDHLFCNGLVRTLAKDRPVIVPCCTSYFTSVRFMYSDHPNITVVEVPGMTVFPFVPPMDPVGSEFCARMEREGCEIMKLGGLGGDPTWGDANWHAHVHEFTSFFYQQAGVPYENMRTAFFAPEWVGEDSQMREEWRPPKEKFIVVHEYASGSRNFLIDHARIPRLNRVNVHDAESNIFALDRPLANAEEVHCITSWMLVLLELHFKNVGKKLVLHGYARRDHPGFELQRDWNILE
jgi:hypothetical protein